MGVKQPRRYTAVVPVPTLRSPAHARLHAVVRRSRLCLACAHVGWLISAVFRCSRHQVRALHAAVRACRRVYSEYQGQLLWKAVSPGGGRGEDLEGLAAAFEVEVSETRTTLYYCISHSNTEKLRSRRAMIIPPVTSPSSPPPPSLSLPLRPPPPHCNNMPFINHVRP